MSHLPECSGIVTMTNGNDLFAEPCPGCDPQSAAAEFAKPTLRQCGCTFYPDKAECLHTQIYEDRMRSFLAGVQWAKGAA